ncbi:inositol monophosphatase family protein [Roseicyclus mahoneyensis]|uniref:Inositol-1-monophosphatase n=1 Tax=Roseicyclus mahoneyensis TaxID=164332 RepID=A0A316GDU3_9RHOB|nr:inositol monophosphatase family protein [Roseicyclus mahoneyensis]PWK59179.1 myo-inositol-1(or 4)-monophosphatase [Roseicyclus mahoneyensis]
MTDPIAARAALASDLAQRAGHIALDYYRRRDSLEIETKTGALDLVSIADRAVEDMIRAEIAAAFPDDAILGEEGGAMAGRSGLTWVIDPIDGTVPFLMGLPHWCVVIALIEGTETHLGVIDVPMAGEHFAARAGRGVTLDGKRLTLDPTRAITQGLVAVGASNRSEPEPIVGIIQGLMQAGGMFYRNGSGANMLANVAAGRLAAYVEPAMNPWDSLAGLLMIREAGGVTFAYPADATLGLTLGAAPGVWDDLLAIVTRQYPEGLPQPQR